jgi:hypothetical protein
VRKSVEESAAQTRPPRAASIHTRQAVDSKLFSGAIGEKKFQKGCSGCYKATPAAHTYKATKATSSEGQIVCTPLSHSLSRASASNCYGGSSSQSLSIAHFRFLISRDRRGWWRLNSFASRRTLKGLFARSIFLYISLAVRVAAAVNSWSDTVRFW